jgi:hypothetical protein
LKLRVGYKLQYEFPQPTPLIALNIHFSRVADLAAPDHIVISPSVPISCYRDGFGNWCCRILAPAGHVRLSTDAVVTDSGWASIPRNSLLIKTFGGSFHFGRARSPASAQSNV